MAGNGVDSTESPYLRRLGATARLFRARANNGRGVSLTEISAATGKSVTSIWRFEQGKSRPRNIEDFISAYAKCCGATYVEIWQVALDIPTPKALPSLLHSAADYRQVLVLATASALVSIAIFAAVSAAGRSFAIAYSGAMSALLLTGSLTMAVLIVPYLTNLASLTRVGAWLFALGLLGANVYTIVRIALGREPVTYPTALATQSAVAIGWWLIAIGLARANLIVEGTLANSLLRRVSIHGEAVESWSASRQDPEPFPDEDHPSDTPPPGP